MLLNGFGAARRSNLLLLEGLEPDAWARRGSVNGHRFSVRALAYLLLGHERAHLEVLSTRYS